MTAIPSSVSMSSIPSISSIPSTSSTASHCNDFGTERRCKS